MVSAAGECRLCLKARPLCDSHIIPEWLYSPLYDEIHRYRVLRTDQSGRNTFAQKGIREAMLCQPCETDLSVYEGYARGVLMRGPEIEILKTKRGIEVSGLDYVRFKLFQLSVLLRAGVSHDPFFSMVDLGDHSETLRKMLRASDPGRAVDYGCILVTVIAEKQLLTDLITQPLAVVGNGSPMVRFIFGGLAWLFVLGRGDSHPFADLFLTETGVLVIRPGGKVLQEYLRRLAITFVPTNGLAI